MTDPAPPEAPEAPKPPPKKLGPIRWKMIVAVVVFWVALGVGLYVTRDTLIHRGVESGGRASFQTAVTLDAARSGLSPARTDVLLQGLQVPDRADLSRNAIQVEELELAVSPLDLLSGQVHVERARAKNVAFDVPRPTPAEPLPMTGEPAPVTSTTDDGSSFFAGLFGQEGGLLQSLLVSERPWGEVLDALGLETVAYAKGLPGRIEAARTSWGPKLEGHRKELEALQERGRALRPRVDELATSIRDEWGKTLAEKRRKLDELEQALKKDPNAAGKNPATDIPRRVEQELADLDQVKAREEARTTALRQELKQLDDDLARLQQALAALDQETKQAQQELAAEVAKARKATQADAEKLKQFVDPSKDKVDELLVYLVGPRAAKQIRSAQSWVSLLWRLIPPRPQRVVKPTSPREGIDVPVPPPPGAEDAARAALARLLIDDLELDGRLQLDGEPLSLAGHVKNLSDAPWLVGREIGLELEGTLGEAAAARKARITGGLVPDAERARLHVSAAGLALTDLVLREGDPAPDDLFPRRIAKVGLDLEVDVDSTPERLVVSIDTRLTGIEWGPLPTGGQAAPAVRAVRDVVAGVKDARLVIELTLPASGAPGFSVKDLSEPSLTGKLRDQIGAAVAGEVQRITAGYQQQLDRTLAADADAARKALDAANAEWAKELGGVAGLAKQASGGGASQLDQAVASGDAGKKALAEEAVPRLLKAATQGGLKLPDLPKGLPFGKD